jgi:transcriptional regulator with XRE-family HTH domain
MLNPKSGKRVSYPTEVGMASVESPVVRRGRVRSMGRLNLCGCRQKRGVTLEQIAESTKISMRFLRAIEDEEFEKLPGGIFSTSYLRQYASEIGFDESELLSRYNEVMFPPSPLETARTGEAPKGLLGRWLGLAAPVQRP